MSGRSEDDESDSGATISRSSRITLALGGSILAGVGIVAWRASQIVTSLELLGGEMLSISKRVEQLEQWRLSHVEFSADKARDFEVRIKQLESRK